MSATSRPCSFEGCPNQNHATGLCSAHYHQARTGRDLKPLYVKPLVCGFDGCDKPYSAKGYCVGHYDQQKNGRPILPLRVAQLYCTYPDCRRPHCAKGYCQTHYRHWQSGVELVALQTTRPKQQCKLDGCDEPYKARGWCSSHYSQARRGVAPHLIEPQDWHVGANGYVVKSSMYQHRVVMEERLGRPLLPEENVHHLNGVKHDNRVENLELWSTSQPYGQRVEDKADWAVEMLALYRPDALARPVLRLAA